MLMDAYDKWVRLLDEKQKTHLPVLFKVSSLYVFSLCGCVFGVGGRKEYCVGKGTR
jgi:hypothetical protein